MDRKLRTHEMNRLKAEVMQQLPRHGLCFALNNVRSALNVGSIFRTSDAFLLDPLILCGHTPQPPSAEMQKTALGATETVGWKYHEFVKDAVAELKQNHTLLAVEITQKACNLHQFDWQSSKPFALFLGNEITGVDDDVLAECDQVIQVPQFGSKHSLNVAVCAGIVAWDFMQKRILASI